jgi:hypothetical protein
MEKIKGGELKAKQSQIDRLQSLLDGQQAYLYADAELKRGMIGLLYERQVYLSKLWLLEKLGVRNHWNHPLLHTMNMILYEETDEFKLEDTWGARSKLSGTVIMSIAHGDALTWASRPAVA